jgi:hypothetical protein
VFGPHDASHIREFKREETVIAQMPPKVLFQKMAGRWEGTCRTWFEPEKLADESNVKGEFTDVLDGLFLRHTYQGSMPFI